VKTVLSGDWKMEPLFITCKHAQIAIAKRRKLLMGTTMLLLTLRRCTDHARKEKRKNYAGTKNHFPH
jgi:hypothetical protein